MRGGDAMARRADSMMSGRSPHARGRRFFDSGRRSMGGSIPACAGETARRSGPTSTPAVDPRMRGGDRDSYTCKKLRRVRSPHALGRRRVRIDDPLPVGSIPALAGGDQHCCPHRLWISCWGRKFPTASPSSFCDTRRNPLLSHPNQGRYP